jgi:hypothetical protein
MDMNYAYLLDGVTIGSQLADEAVDGDAIQITIVGTLCGGRRVAHVCNKRYHIYNDSRLFPVMVKHNPVRLIIFRICDETDKVLNHDCFRSWSNTTR